MYSFPIWSQSVVPYPFLTVASWPAYRFLRRQVRCSGIHISLKNFLQSVVIYTVKGFGIVNKAEIDVFLSLSCFFNDPADFGHLISGSVLLMTGKTRVKKFCDVRLKLMALGIFVPSQMEKKFFFRFSIRKILQILRNDCDFLIISFSWMFHHMSFQDLTLQPIRMSQRFCEMLISNATACFESIFQNH